MLVTWSSSSESGREGQVANSIAAVRRVTMKKKTGLTTTLVRGILDNSCRLSPERRPAAEG